MDARSGQRMPYWRSGADQGGTDGLLRIDGLQVGERAALPEGGRDSGGLNQVVEGAGNTCGVDNDTGKVRAMQGGAQFGDGDLGEFLGRQRRYPEAFDPVVGLQPG